MTVEDKKRGRPQKDKQALSKELIINVAKQMMLNNKKVPSIRAISTALNVDAMALYYYFKNKSVLLEEITTSLISDIYEPTGSDDWESELIELSKSYLTILYKYDGLLKTLLSMSSDSPADVFIGRFSFIVNPLSLEKSQEKAFLDLLVDYLHGFSMALACNSTQALALDDIEPPLALLFQGVVLQKKTVANGCR